MAGMTTDTTALASDPVTNEVLAGKVVEAVKAVQDAEETVVLEGKRLTAHMADPTAHGTDITTCIGQAISDHNGDDTAHGEVITAAVGQEVVRHKNDATAHSAAITTSVGQAITVHNGTADAHGLAAFKTDLSVSTLVRTDNPALTDARTPLAHHHQASEIEGIPAGAVGAEQLSTAITTHNNDANAHGGSGQALITAHNADAKAHGIGTTGSPLMTSIEETVQAFADDFIAGGEGCITIKGQVSSIKDLAAQYANAAPGVEVETGKVGVQTYVKKADDFANGAPRVQVEPGKYSSRHWAEEARARADAASAVSGLPAFGLEDVRKAIVVNEDASGWNLSDSVGGFFPGFITPFYGSLDDTGKHPLVKGAALSDWHVCDGTDGTPDMRDRVAVGVSATKVMGSSGGAESVVIKIDPANITFTGSADPTTLSESQIASHNHGVQIPKGNFQVVIGSGNYSPRFSHERTDLSGGGNAHSHSISGSSTSHTHTVSGAGGAISILQAYTALHYIIYMG